jgi:hypothetical protein
MMAAVAKNNDYDQMDLFELSFVEEEPVENTSIETTIENPQERLIELNDNKESKHSEGASIYYRGEEGVYLKPYSKDHKTSSIMLGESHIVVLTSAIETR